MGYFAELNEHNVVLRVIVADSKEWCEQYLKGVWVKASEPLKASIDFTYDAEKNIFIPPKPYDSWLLDEYICEWKAPIPYPTDGKLYSWNEDLGDWEEIDE